MIRKISYVMLMASLTFLPLVFTSGCAVGGGRESVGQYADDKAIASRIKTNLYSDDYVKGSQVEVLALRGHVQLAGFVDNQMAKDRAGQIAQQTPGVQMVHNDLIVGAASGTTTPTGR